MDVINYSKKGLCKIDCFIFLLYFCCCLCSLRLNIREKNAIPLFLFACVLNNNKQKKKKKMWKQHKSTRCFFLLRFISCYKCIHKINIFNWTLLLCLFMFVTYKCYMCFVIRSTNIYLYDFLWVWEYGKCFKWKKKKLEEEKNDEKFIFQTHTLT